MDSSLIIAVGAAFVLGLLAAILWLRARSAPAEATARAEAAEIAGRLAQMAESQAAVQARLSEQMQAQERAVTKALEERLADFAKRVGDRMQEGATQSQTALSDLRERLAVIDRAQKNITELSTQVVGLQDVLSNKQARGAFGEIQLNDIVKSVLPPGAYGFQVTLGNGKRADCLIRLPN